MPIRLKVIITIGWWFQKKINPRARAWQLILVLAPRREYMSMVEVVQMDQA